MKTQRSAEKKAMLNHKKGEIQLGKKLENRETKALPLQKTKLF